MVHVLVVDHDVILRRHVIRNVVVDDEPQKAIQHRPVDLLRDVLELGLQDDNALAIRRVPDVRQVIDTLAPLVHQQGGRLRVCRLDPVGEEVAVVTLVPQVLVQVSISDLLQRLNLVAWHQVRVHVLELDGHLLEGSLSEQVALDPAESLVGIVVGLLNKAQLLTLLLVQACLHRVLLLQPLQSQDEQLGVVLVVERREGDGRELPRLEPMHGRGVDGHSLLAAHVWAVLQVVVLALLLSLEPQACQASQVLLARCLVDSGTTTNPLAVVVGGIGPPVRLGLDVAQDHVLNWRGQARDLPGNVGLPATPRLGEVLQDGPCLVGPHTLWHHVDDVVHHGRAKLQVEVALHALFGDCLGDALRDTALELTCQQVPQPALEQWHDATQEEEPHAPARRPETTPRPLADGPGVEAVVDQVLQVLAHAHLPHEPVFVPVHTCQLTHVGKNVLQTVGKLEGVDVPQTELHVTVHNQLGQTHDLTAQVERVPEPGLLALFGRERLHRLQVEVVVEVQEVQVLPCNEEVQHVVALTTDLQPDLHPVEFRPLEKLGRGENVHQVALIEGLGWTVVELVQHPDLQELLVRDAHLDGVVGRAVLFVPLSGEGHVLGTPHVAAAQVEGSWCPVKSDAVRRAVGKQRRIVKQRPHFTGEPEGLDLRHVQQVLRSVGHRSVGRQWVHNGIVVEGRQIRVVGLDVAHRLVVVGRQGNLPRS
mmetsp:Transcript_889/g.2132  ORF Transcript_889/g.2132 Transcript_889/m.2132 type:complete len:706 (-) Transcript_889:1206-3323(-)